MTSAFFVIVITILTAQGPRVMTLAPFPDRPTCEANLVVVLRQSLANGVDPRALSGECREVRDDPEA